MKMANRMWRGACGASGGASGIASSVKDFLRNQSGSAITWAAISLPVIFGAAGLGVDATLWYMDKRVVQNVADSAAVAATHLLSGGGGADAGDQTAIDELGAAMQAAAEEDAQSQGFDISPADAVVVNYPPKNGALLGDLGAVEVFINRRRELYLAQVLSEQGAVNIQGRSVGGLQVFGSHCILGLHQTDAGTVEFAGTADATIDCGVASNSNSAKSIAITGKASLHASPAQAYGDVYVDNNATLTSDHPVQSLSQRVPDPYGPEGKNLQVPTYYKSLDCYGGGAYDDLNTPTPVEGMFTTIDSTLNPTTETRFCGGLKITKDSIIFFKEGLYFIDSGDLIIEGGADVSGNATFILTTSEADPATVGVATLSGGADINLKPTMSGAFSGILIFQDQMGGAAGSLIEDSAIGGGGVITLQGAMYFPSSTLTFAGGVAGGAGCLTMIALRIRFAGVSFIQNDEGVCDAIGVDTMAQSRVVIVE